MNNNSQETEVKIYIPDLHTLEQHLQSAGAYLAQERVHERNMRYDTENSSLTQRNVVLRLREDVHVTLTYKSGGAIERGIVTREELEVQVSDFNTMEAILGKFGFEQYMYYEKFRTIYEFHDTAVMLDELPFGNFVEVEGTPDQIEAVLDKLGLQDAKRHEDSYAKLFDFVKHHLELTFRDLTFENFADIDVPESAFIPPGSIVVG